MPDAIGRVADKFLDELRLMVADRKIKIVCDDSAKAWLVERGYDVAMGARPMKRVIAESIKKPLSKMMVLGELTDGGKITLMVKNNELVLKKTKR